MDNITMIISNIYKYQFLILAVSLALCLIWIIILSYQVTSLNKKYKKFMKGTSARNIEQIILDQMSRVEGAVDRVELMNNDILELKHQVDKCIQKHGILRYNAFSDTGSDLSYSISLLDNYNDGVLITGIYGRNESVTYAKPIANGESKYPLSNEEELILKRSLKTGR